MDQQQFKVSFSVRTKLLISLVFLLFTVILFLNFSSIVLFREDKRTYIYETQATEALLASKEFVTQAKNAINTLRTLLATVDPKNPKDSRTTSLCQSIIDNQTLLLSSSVFTVNPTNKVQNEFLQNSKLKQLQDLDMKLADYQISPGAMSFLLPQIWRNSYGFLNLSRLGSLPVLAIAIADPKLIKNQAEPMIALGLISLKGFGMELRNVKLTIASRDGGVLYDTDPAVLFAQQNISEMPLFKAARESRLANGAQEFDFNGYHWLGSFVNPDLDLIVLSMAEWHKAMKATYKLIEKFILTASMAIGAAIVFAIFFSKTLTAPLTSLYNATREIASGNFSIKLEEKGRDEFSALSTSFNAMSLKIGELVEERIVKARLEQELAIASAVQQTLIPPNDYQTDRIHIRSHYQSASECGGDWWGFFSVGSKICLMIADATGHGLPCALITASARSCVSVLHKLAEEDPDFSFSPSAMLSFLNQVIFDASHGKIMMTFFVGVIDFDQMTLKYSSAAHNPPWLFSKDGDTVQLKSLIAVGRRLGEVKTLPQFVENSVQIRPNDILILYTDGLLEGTNQAGKPFGKKKFRALVESSLALGPQVIVESIVKDFSEYNVGKDIDDDLTIAVVKILS